MASTPLRFIAQGSKLQPGLTSSMKSRYSCVHNVIPKRPLLRTAPLLFNTHTCQRRAFSRPREYSTSMTLSTRWPLSNRGSDSLSRWSTQYLAKFVNSTQIAQFHCGQRWFASNQSIDQSEKKQEPVSSPSPPQQSKVATPEILAKALSPTPHENIYTVPNLLTFSRLLSAPAIGYFILSSQPVLAFSLFAYAGFTDLIDGFLARRFNQTTVVGTVIDPMADKTLMTVVVVCLGLQGVIPVWLAAIILGRDVGLAISAIYYRYISLPPPKTFARYWDFSLPSAEVRPTEISKINTLLQLLLLGNAMVLPVLPAAWVEAWNLVGVFEGWQFLVAGTTIWSGLSYVYNKDAVKILSAEEGVKKEKEMKRAKEGMEEK